MERIPVTDTEIDSADGAGDEAGSGRLIADRITDLIADAMSMDGNDDSTDSGDDVHIYLVVIPDGDERPCFVAHACRSENEGDNVSVEQQKIVFDLVDDSSEGSEEWLTEVSFRSSEFTLLSLRGLLDHDLLDVVEKFEGQIVQLAQKVSRGEVTADGISEGMVRIRLNFFTELSLCVGVEMHKLRAAENRENLVRRAAEEALWRAKMETSGAQEALDRVMHRLWDDCAQDEGALSEVADVFYSAKMRAPAWLKLAENVGQSDSILG
jgi:hypothetical protein